MAGRREVSFEVHVMQGESWHIQARYTAAKGKIAIEEAKAFGQKSHKGARVIRESYDPDSGRSEEIVVFQIAPNVAQEKSATALRAGFGGSAGGRAGPARGAGPSRAEGNRASRGSGGRHAQNVEVNYAAAPELRKGSFVGSLVKFLIGALVCVAVAAALTFVASIWLEGSSFGRAARTNLLSAIFVGTFLILAVVIGYSSLKNRRASPAPRAQSRPRPARKKKLDTSKYEIDIEEEKESKKKKKKEEEEEPEKDLSLDLPETEEKEAEEEEPVEEVSVSLTPNGEKQKIYLMQYLGQALAMIQSSEITMDAFNKFGINLFLAGACEILNEKRNVDPRDAAEILTEAVSLLGFKKEEASNFSENYQEYLLADVRYMQIFQAGRNAMNTYFTEENSGTKQMTVAIEDWNKPKQKEENAGPVTVMFTDIVGSTAMTQDLGDAVAQQIVRAHNRVIREALTKFGGKEIKHTGDGIMASFPITSNGIEASMDMQRNVGAHNEANPDLPLHIKIGLNAGEPIAEDNDLFGTTVQMAARIVDKAQTEQIFVSEIVQGICSGKDIKFESRGGFPMKGFENDPTLYEVIWTK